MKEQTKEKIAFLVVLLFCLAYLIPWSYDKVIRQPREATEKEILNYLQSEAYVPYYWIDESVIVVSHPPTQDDFPTLDGEINQEQERFQLTAYYKMPKSVDLLIQNVFSVEENKEEIYKLIWKWQGYKYDAEKEMIILPNLYYDDLLYIKAVENFIEWLYENDYEIVKK